MPPRLGGGLHVTHARGEGDSITISDESGEGPHSTCDRVTDKGTEIPRVKGQMLWPTRLRAVEEEQRKKEEEEEEKQELQEQWRQQELLEQQQ
jgi:hypothetical protein